MTMTDAARRHMFLRKLPVGNRMAQRHAEPAMLTAHHDCEFREVLDRVGDKWSLLVIAMLEQRPTPRARFSESMIRAARETFDGRSPRRKAAGGPGSERPGSEKGAAFLAAR
jgi:hypothetical protein